MTELTIWQQAEIEKAKIAGNRQSNLDSLRALKSLHRTITRDAELNGTTPNGELLGEINRLISRVLGRLV